jgi:single stranded DNA-binding protein
MIGHAHIHILGTVVADPEHTTTQSGKSLLKLRVAVNEKRGDQETASFFNIESWRESLNEKLKAIPMKGKNVLVSGTQYEDRWEKDGVKFKDFPIRLDKVIFVDKKEPAGESQNPGF